MHKTLLAAVVSATVFAAPAFAQVIPGSATQAAARSSTQVGAATTGVSASAGENAGVSTTTSTGGSGTQPLGLGGLLEQTQAASPSLSPDTATDGAGPTGSLGAKARAKAHAHGH